MMFIVRPRRQVFDLNVWATYFLLSLGSAVLGQYGSSLVIEPAVVTIRNGTLLELKCTLTDPVRGSQLSAENLTWSHNGRWLTSNTHVLNNKTIQLSIASASWENAGQYWCKVGNSDDSFYSAANASVTIGDVPSKPQIVKWENLEFHLQLYWKGPSYDGGLPLKYSLKTKCRNCDFIAVGSQSYKNGLYSNIYSVVIYKYLRVWIEAKNAVGTSESPTVDIYLTYNYGTVHACPPIIKSARGQSRAIEVQLGRRDSTHCKYGADKPLIFNISYWTRESSHLETKLFGPTTQRVLTLEPLKPFTQYYLNVSVRIVVGKLLTLPSSVVGPFTEVTSEEAPSEGPTSVVCYSAVWPDNRRMNITIKWKPPPRSKRNGIIRSYRLRYSYQELVTKNLTLSNASTRELVLLDLNALSLYHLFLQACTIGEACSSSTPCTVAPAVYPAKIEAASKSRWLMGFIIALGIIIVLLVVVPVFCLWKKEKLCFQPFPPCTGPMPIIDSWIDVAPRQNEWTDQLSTSYVEPLYCDIEHDSEESKKGLLVDINSN